MRELTLPSALVERAAALGFCGEAHPTTCWRGAAGQSGAGERVCRRRSGKDARRADVSTRASLSLDEFTQTSTHEYVRV